MSDQPRDTTVDANEPPLNSNIYIIKGSVLSHKAHTYGLFIIPMDVANSMLDHTQVVTSHSSTAFNLDLDTPWTAMRIALNQYITQGRNAPNLSAKITKTLKDALSNEGRQLELLYFLEQHDTMRIERLLEEVLLSSTNDTHTKVHCILESTDAVLLQQVYTEHPIPQTISVRVSEAEASTRPAKALKAEDFAAHGPPPEGFIVPVAVHFAPIGGVMVSNLIKGRKLVVRLNHEDPDSVTLGEEIGAFSDSGEFLPVSAPLYCVHCTDKYLDIYVWLKPDVFGMCRLENNVRIRADKDYTIYENPAEHVNVVPPDPEKNTQETQDAARLQVITDWVLLIGGLFIVALLSVLIFSQI